MTPKRGTYPATVALCGTSGESLKSGQNHRSDAASGESVAGGTCGSSSGSRPYTRTQGVMPESAATRATVPHSADAGPWTLTLRDEPGQRHTTPAIIRLRHALKRLLRDHGFRCTSVAPASPADASAAAADVFPNPKHADSPHRDAAAATLTHGGRTGGQDRCCAAICHHEGAARD